MELQFESSGLHYLRRSIREVQNQEQTLELRLNDGMPDIGRVLCSRGQVILRGKEWRGGEFSISGGVQVSTLYMPEDGSDVRCMEGWLPFRMNWDLGSETREGTIRAYPLLRFADARSVSSRKLMVRVGIAMLGEAMVPDQVQIPQPGELPGGVHLLETTYPVKLTKQAGEKAFSMDEDLTLSGSQPEKILYGCLQPEVNEARVSGNRLIFRGNANLHLLYRGEDGGLHSWEEPLPFSQLAELEQVFDDNAEGDVTMAVTALEMNLEEGGNLRLKCSLLGQYTVDNRELVTVVEDAYSTAGKLEPKWDVLTLPATLDERQHPITGEQTVHQQAESIVDAAFLPDFPRQHRGGDTVELEIPGQFQVLYTAEDGTLQAGSARWEGQLDLKAGENATIQAEPTGVFKPQAAAQGDEIRLRADGMMTARTMANQEIPVVAGFALSDAGESNPTRPSLILRRAGKDRLWDIAKKSGSTMAAIREANGEDAPRSEDQILLIPVS